MKHFLSFVRGLPEDRTIILNDCTSCVISIKLTLRPQQFHCIILSREDMKGREISPDVSDSWRPFLEIGRKISVVRATHSITPAFIFWREVLQRSQLVSSDRVTSGLTGVNPQVRFAWASSHMTCIPSKTAKESTPHFYQAIFKFLLGILLPGQNLTLVTSEH